MRIVDMGTIIASEDAAAAPAKTVMSLVVVEQ
jgi:hypothetical protein